METDREARAHGNWRPGASWYFGLAVYLALAVAAVLTPHVVAALWGVYWAATVATVVFGMWVSTMPCTCMSGGLLCSLVAMVIFVNAVVLLLASLGKALLSLVVSS
jgi:hypothetical protein